MAADSDRPTVKRVKVSKHSWFSIARDDLGYLFDAGVATTEVDRIARIVGIEQDQGELIAKWLRGMLLGQAQIWNGREGLRDGFHTRSQLLKALRDALRRSLKGKTETPEWVVDELYNITERRRTNAPYGVPPRVISLDEAGQIAIENLAARQIFERNLTTAESFRSMIIGAIDQLKAEPVTTAQYFASKAAYSPEKQAAIGGVYDFWIGPLGRSPEVSKSLLEFADRVVRVCGVVIELEALRRQLHLARRAREVG